MDAVNSKRNGSGVMDICLDFGLRPRIRLVDKTRVYLFDESEAVVEMKELQHVFKQVGIERFGPDNRASLDKSIHRISRMMNTRGEPYAVTMRVGRPVVGCAMLFLDLLYHTKSVLIVGPPGSGKTTVIRDIIRTVSKQQE